MYMNLISIKDLNKQQIKEVYELVPKYKLKDTTTELKNKYIGLIFEKPSTRTRVSFEVGIHQLGGIPIELDEKQLQLSRGETIKDTANIFNHYLDGLILRVHKHTTLLEFSKYSKIPIVNALSDEEHPCQVISDIWTVLEIKKVKLDELNKIKFVYVGDFNNVCRSLVYISEILDINSYFIIPKKYQPKAKFKENIIITDEIEKIKDADVIYTDVWVSMGQEKERKKRIKVFKPYQVNSKLISLAKPDCIVMHCLPANRGLEITDEVIDGKNSVVIKQAENRLYVQKALMVYIFKNK
ncbi:MAG: ornithine carbamoyltransferase [Elusimicrobiota bacterium]|nr:ornithine carbamoyltransferase [Endomicrobiia bacterium]MDW8165219.1 ornithine carbamoyltransferase [Elusimicrobiota bacterium]